MTLALQTVKRLLDLVDIWPKCFPGSKVISFGHKRHGFNKVKGHSNMDHMIFRPEKRHMISHIMVTATGNNWFDSDLMKCFMNNSYLQVTSSLGIFRQREGDLLSPSSLWIFQQYTHAYCCSCYHEWRSYFKHFDRNEYFAQFCGCLFLSLAVGWQVLNYWHFFLSFTPRIGYRDGDALTWSFVVRLCRVLLLGWAVVF